METALARTEPSEAPPIDDRFTGAGVGLVLSAVIGLVVAMVGAPFLLLGVPAAGVSGWILGPRLRTEALLTSGALMGALTVVVADSVLIVGTTALAVPSSIEPSRDFVSVLTGAAAYWALGLVFVGLPMLLLTIPCGVVWAYLGRRLAEAG